MPDTSLQVQGAQFARDIFETVRSMSKDIQGVSRQGYSQLETDVLHYLMGLGQQLDLSVCIDKAGNVWMTLPGEDRSLPAFVTGSHVDSVPQGGNYDGLAGVCAALTVAWWMRKTQFTPKRDFTVLMMRCEESSFFGKAYVGSLGMMGRLTQKDLALNHRTDSITLGECIRACGLNPEDLITGVPVIDLARIAAFVELHIEQGPMLDRREDVRVAVVTGIRGNIRHKTVRCLGETAHSGAVDKAFRHDAVMATAELIHTMENHWQSWVDGGDDLVFTVGVLKTAPSSAISVIPGEAVFTIDMRSLRLETIERFHELLMQEAQAIAMRRGVRFEFDTPLYTQPAQVSESLSDKLIGAARDNDIPTIRLASGAGHDSAVIGNMNVPVAMIFVANQNGSHNPHEAMKLEDFMIGCDLLWRTVESFDK